MPITAKTILALVAALPLPATAAEASRTCSEWFFELRGVSLEPGVAAGAGLEVELSAGAEAVRIPAARALEGAPSDVRLPGAWLTPDADGAFQVVLRNGKQAFGRERLVVVKRRDFGVAFGRGTTLTLAMWDTDGVSQCRRRGETGPRVPALRRTVALALDGGGVGIELARLPPVAPGQAEGGSALVRGSGNKVLGQVHSDRPFDAAGVLVAGGQRFAWLRSGTDAGTVTLLRLEDGRYEPFQAVDFAGPVEVASDRLVVTEGAARIEWGWNATSRRFEPRTPKR